MALRQINRVRDPSRTHERTGQRIVLTLRDGIELVIVAAGTGDRHRLKRFRKSIDLVVEHFLMNAVELGTVAVPILAHLEEHRSNERFVDLVGCIHAWRFEQIPRNLLTDQLFERYITVKGTDQVVAISPRALRGNVPFVSVGVRIANDIHPVPRPAFPEVRRVEQPVYQGFVSG